jgi:hypothetical protein
MDVNIVKKEGKIKYILWIAFGDILQVSKFTLNCDTIIAYHKNNAH